jgi:acyl dehydratase
MLRCKEIREPLTRIVQVIGPAVAVARTGPTPIHSAASASFIRQAIMSQQQVLAALQARVGQEIHLSDWLEVTQARINAFADATGDHQWIHVDRERAARESPWKTTIAHGYLTLSLYPLLRGLVDEEQPLFPGVKQVINYGLDKLRFPNAVKSGSRVRARCVLLKVEEAAGGLQMSEQYTVEIEGEPKPACVAEAIMRAYF